MSKPEMSKEEQVLANIVVWPIVLMLVLWSFDVFYFSEYGCNKVIEKTYGHGRGYGCVQVGSNNVHVWRITK